MNDLMSGGPAPAVEGRAGRQGSIRRASRAFRHLDVAGGTGDIAFRVAEAGGARTASDRLDINADMLRSAASAPPSAARRPASRSSRATPRRCRSQIAFDAYTIAFGIRNVPRIERALPRRYRVLKRGGAVPLPRILAGRPAGARPAL